MFELFGFLVTIDLVEGWLEIVQSILKRAFSFIN